ncbi:IS1182 family transposase, partial [Streptococcus sp. H49]|uniref:IS1182 family transposase n=1 Tax=Streptococcus huangxiaojuni TaxID=3237239 RepID=UPI0034A110E9
KEYNTNQLSLELNLAYDIPMNHEVRLISLFVDSIPNHVLLEEKSHTGRPAFHPAMLLKMTLFAYARQVFSGRKMVQMNDEVIPMKWLSQDSYVSYKTLNNFRSSKPANKLIKTAFIYFTLLMRENGMIEDDALFIDGTKLEADANRYSFTWKKAVTKYEEALNGKTAELYDNLVQEGVDLALSKEACDTSEGLVRLLEDTEQALTEVEKAISEEPKVIKGGSANKRKRRRLKKVRHQLRKDVIPRKQRYEEAREILQDRNSFSKTDHDATFMRMKEDHMMNGQLKPGYNVQAATNGQYVLAYDIFPNPTDTRTLKPFLESIQTLDLFQHIVADAGYGSEENYVFIMDELEKTPLIPYGMYQKELTRKYQNSPTNPNNWDYLEETDQFIKPDGVVYSFKNYSRRRDKYGFKRDFKIYEADNIQDTPELEDLAKTEGGHQRQIYCNPTWNDFKELIKEALHSEEGSRIYAKRKIDVEPVFGRLKSVFGVRRVHVRGHQAVQTEVGFLFMSMNLTKLAKNLPSKTSNTQKPHSDSFILIVFKTEITVWFYFETSFCP